MSTSTDARARGSIITLLCSLGAVLLALLAAAPAGAVTPSTSYVHTSTMSVVPAAGSTISGSAGITGNYLLCHADGSGICSVTDTQVTDSPDFPTTGWPVYTLVQYDTPTGYAMAFQDSAARVQCDMGTGCAMPNDHDGRIVYGRWADALAPTLTSVSIPPTVPSGYELTAQASDNVSVTGYEWTVCAAGNTGCGATTRTQTGRIT